MDKGEVKEHILQQDIMDVNGNYDRNKPFVGALGGQIMQLAMAIQAMRMVEKDNQVEKLK